MSNVIKASGISRSTVTSIADMHFTGGMHAIEGPQGWAVGPVLTEGKLSGTVFLHEKLGQLEAELGTRPLGVDEITQDDPQFPSRIWTTFLGAPKLKWFPADSWGMIAHNARAAGDQAYASKARFLMLSLRAAELQMRAASYHYRAQLLSALRQNRKAGQRFKNVQLMDLHVTFHSMLTEMAAARDYLAQIVATKIGAPDNVDALSRLRNWLQKPANQHLQADPAAALILGSATGQDPWMQHLAHYRNAVVHQEPMAANETASWISLIGTETNYGTAFRIGMTIDLAPGDTASPDALSRFSLLFARLCRLADAVSTMAPYEATPPTFVA